ncbi:MAG: amidinotransferase [Flavobacteriales bacterium]|nr:amidinotransferase [Flavobacteriales bacterium]
MIKINITNEIAQLRAVIVGIANAFGGIPTLEECYDPKSKEHVRLGIFPLEKDCISAMDALVKVFKKYNVTVYRPQNIKGLNQIFSRDIAFAIGDKLVLPNIIKDRRKEVEAIDSVLNQIEELDKIRMPEDTRAEGGDVILCDDYIFVGYSEKEDFERYTVARTNRAGLDFLATTFYDKKVKGLELRKSDDDAKENVLHLDCCFQPIGKDMAILYKGGFKNEKDYNFLVNHFKKENIIELSRDEMYSMSSNIFSISDKVIISEERFSRLNSELRKRGFIVEEVPYAEIAKMSGLFRCSTMPLVRC